MLGLEDIFGAEPDIKEEQQKAVSRYSTTKHVVNGETLSIRLLDTHPLWGHLIWNAGIRIAKWFEDNLNDPLYTVKNKSVVELGAGGALPSFAASLLDASNVVITDYPDDDLMGNISYNVSQNPSISSKNNTQVIGYLWGSSVQPLLEANGGKKFDIVIMADVIFNHSEHAKLAKSCVDLLNYEENKDAVILCSFSHYRTKMVDEDLKFFDYCHDVGLKIVDCWTEKIKSVFNDEFANQKIINAVNFYILKK